MRITKGAIAAFSFLIVLLFCQSANAQVVHFKPNTVHGDAIDQKYGLKFDSVQVYCVELDKMWTVVKTDAVDLAAYTSGIDETASSSGFNILSAIIRDGMLEANYFSDDACTADFIIVNTIGQNVVQSKVNLMSGDNMVYMSCPNLSDGVYVLQAQTMSGSDQYKFALTNTQCDGISKMKVLANEDYTYNFTGYCANRPPCELKGQKPENEETVKFLVAPQLPYCFVKGTVAYDIKNMENDYRRLTYPDSSKGKEIVDITYQAEHIRNANLNCDQISGNSYRITLGWLCYPAPSKLGIDVQFTLGDTTLSDLSVDLDRSESKGKYHDALTQYIYNFKSSFVSYKLENGVLIVELDADDMKQVGTEFKYSYFEFVDNSHYQYGEENATISKDLTGSSWKMMLYLW